MKKCPKCNRTYPDENLNFCLDDGNTLNFVSDEFATKVLPKKKKSFKIFFALAILITLFVISLVALIGVYQFRNEIATLFGISPEVTHPTPSPSPNTPPDLTDEQQILNLFKTLRKAYAEDDYDALEKIMADEYVEKNSFGQKLTKKQILSPIKVGKNVSLKHSDLSVEVSGDKAVVDGKGVQKGEFAGVEISVRFTFKTNLKKQDGRWQATYSDIKIKQ